MKYLVAFSCLLALAAATHLAPYAYNVAPASSFGYSSVSHHGYPYHYGYNYPYAYSSVAPVHTSYSAVAPVHTSYSAIAPVVGPVAYAAPVVAPVVSALEKTQYHAQDIFGQASYGHAEAYQSHNAVQDAHGNKVGAYSYVAPNGEVISAEYVADGLGFRVKSNALPAVPAETDEVKAAREEHMKAHAEAKSRTRRGVFYNAYPYSYGYPYAYPVSHEVPVVAKSVVHPVVNTVVPYVHTPVVHAPVVAPVVKTVVTPVVAKTTAYNHVVSTPFQHTESYAVKHF